MENKRYKSLGDIYLQKAFALPVPPLPRQTIKKLFEAIAEAPPPAPDTAYVQLYIKDPSKPDQQFIGNIDVDYFNNVLKPVISRGSQGSIDINRLIEKRLKDANITTENLNIIFDFIQSTGMKISSENFSRCSMLIKNNLVSEKSFNIADTLAVGFAANDSNESVEKLSQSIKANSGDLLKLMRLKAQESSAFFGERSKVAGPGEVVLSFFGNGKKLVTKSKGGEQEGKGDIAIGELKIEIKGTEGRIHPATKILYTSQYGTGKKYFDSVVKTDPKSAIKYLVFGEDGLKNTNFDSEIDAGIKAGSDPLLLATGLALREYQVISGFNYYCFVDSKTANCVGLTCADKDLVTIGKWYLQNIGSRLSFDRQGHKLPPTFKI